MNNSTELTATIIGGGIVGLSTALALKSKHPDWEIAVLEKAPYLADHSTGRNSGVLHSGIYYETNSLKHLLCIDGLNRWRSIIERYQLPHHWCGKFIFAHTDHDVDVLGSLLNKAKANGVPAHLASRNELISCQNDVNAVAALRIESTGIVDVSAAMQAMRDDFENRGGIIQTSTEALSIEHFCERFRIHTKNFSIDTIFLINTAGLWAPQIRELLSLKNMRSKWVKGHYLKTTQKLGYKTLYYPVPPKDLKGLGVHSTIDCQGDVKFGPDTLDVSQVNYNLEPANLDIMKESIRRNFKNVDCERLFPDYAGIRSKIEVNGDLYKDFWIKGPKDLGIEGYVEACGIESPGVTGSPAIAEYISNLIS